MSNDYHLTDTSIPAKELKLVVVGDGYIGKTCMLWSFVYKKFPSGYVPTIFDIHTAIVKINNEAQPYNLTLFDTAGQEDWDALRKMAYPDTDVIILCFSCVRSDSLENITSKWIPELNKLIPTAQIVLVGTQVDLRDKNQNHQNNNSDPIKSRHISTREGEELRHRIKAYKYIECSALTQYNIAEVFSTCVEAVVKVRAKPGCFHSLFKRFTIASWIRKKRTKSSNKKHLHES